jgi:hypothetical protein
MKIQILNSIQTTKQSKEHVLELLQEGILIVKSKVGAKMSGNYIDQKEMSMSILSDGLEY